MAIGAIAVLSFAVAAIWFCRRRMRQRQSASREAQPPYEVDATHQTFYEADAANKVPYEADATGQMLYEADTTSRVLCEADATEKMPSHTTVEHYAS